MSPSERPILGESQSWPSTISVGRRSSSFHFRLSPGTAFTSAIDGPLPSFTLSVSTTHRTDDESFLDSTNMQSRSSELIGSHAQIDVPLAESWTRAGLGVQ
jgi:hypothetical protein